MTVKITLSATGTDTGPFDLYSNVDGYTIPFETNVPKASLVAGFITSLCPDGTTTVRCKSVGDCTNFINIPLILNSYTFRMASASNCPDACAAYSFVVFM